MICLLFFPFFRIKDNHLSELERVTNHLASCLISAIFRINWRLLASVQLADMELGETFNLILLLAFSSQTS